MNIYLIYFSYNENKNFPKNYEECHKCIDEPNFSENFYFHYMRSKSNIYSLISELNIDILNHINSINKSIVNIILTNHSISKFKHINLVELVNLCHDKINFIKKCISAELDINIIEQICDNYLLNWNDLINGIFRSTSSFNFIHSSILNKYYEYLTDLYSIKSLMFFCIKRSLNYWFIRLYEEKYIPIYDVRNNFDSNIMQVSIQNRNLEIINFLNFKTLYTNYFVKSIYNQEISLKKKDIILILIKNPEFSKYLTAKQREKYIPNYRPKVLSI